MNIIFVMAIFFIVVTVIFVAIAIFLPEWMGITGAKARRIIAEQQDSTEASDPGKKQDDKDKSAQA